MYILAVFIAFLGSQLFVTLIDALKQKEWNENRRIANSVGMHQNLNARVTSSWSSLIKRHLSRIVLMSIVYGGVSTVAFSVATIGLLETTHGCLVGILCLTVVILICVSISIALRDRIFAKSQQEIFHLLLSELEHSQNQSQRTILRHAIFKGCSFVVIGGALTGSSMCFAHFSNAAIVAALQGRDMNIDIAPVVLAATFAIIGSIICFLLLFRVVSLFPQYEWLKVITCVLFALVTCGTCYLVHGSIALLPQSISITEKNISIVVIQSICILFSLVVNHWCAADMRTHIRAKMRLAATTQTPQQQYLQEEENSVIAELSSSIRFRSQRHLQVRVRPR